MDTLQQLPLTFGAEFLEDHARRIVTDPAIALVELIANAADAGADMCRVTLTTEEPWVLRIEDNGTGMTSDEFSYRWMTLNYNRAKHQGLEVLFPPGNQISNRRTYGRNGKGRHGMFCFADRYMVTTTKSGIRSIYQVRRVYDGPKPYSVECVRTEEVGDGLHGTTLCATIERNHMRPGWAHELLGTKFAADPAFQIMVNDAPVSLSDLKGVCPTAVPVPGYGEALVYRIDTQSVSRTTKQHGIAWWVEGRSVGDVTWDRRSGGGSFLDGRSTEAKRYTFIVQADMLLDHIESDWTDFVPSEATGAVIGAVENHIDAQLDELLKSTRNERKREALIRHRDAIRSLPPLSRYQVGSFVSQLLAKCTSLSAADLENALLVFIGMERSRRGYDLLRQLSTVAPNHLDALGEILDRWTAQEALLVLEELHRRLDLISQLEKIVDDPKADELHEIQPLLERGLWIFGPEYDSPHFVANRSLCTIVKGEFLKSGDGQVQPEVSRLRPDIVALPEPISVFATDRYDADSNVCGIDKVLILELKRGGSRITSKMMYQAAEYARALRRSGKLSPDTKITAFVLGSSVSPDVEDHNVGVTTHITARPFNVLLRQAHARTFHLQRKLIELRGTVPEDPDVESAITMLPLGVENGPSDGSDVAER